MQDDAFEWDDDKARSNLAKHKIGFVDAKNMFNDPHTGNRVIELRIATRTKLPVLAAKVHTR